MTWAPKAALALLLVLSACGGVGEPPRLGLPACPASQGCTSPENPLAVRLEIPFEDPDGDLAGGVWWAFHGRRLTGEGPLTQRLEAAGLPHGATRGLLTLDVPVELDRMEVGDRFEVSVQLEDASGNESNRPGLVLQMDRP